jgi:cobyrinic acid a,c-diamide synthase
MGEVVQMPKRNVQHASTEELKAEWDKWADDPGEEMDGHAFHYEQIHAELNRRGEGKYCAV